MSIEVEILIAAKAKIQAKEHWGQGRAFAPATGQYCALGALWSQGPNNIRAENILGAALPEGHKSIAAYNDSHTHEDILSLYDRAIRNARTVASLKAAMARIVKPENWTKGVGARDAYGEHVSSLRQEAVSFCAVGAISIVGLPGTVCALRGALPKKKGWQYIAQFNDHPNTTHKQVINLYKRAIRNLGGTP
jgi:hypothetical protein